MKKLWKWISEMQDRRMSDIISALVHTRANGNLAKSPHGSLNLAAILVAAQQARMPDILRLPIRILTMLFDYSGIAFFLCAFRHQAFGQRSAQMAMWRHAAFGPCRDLMRFYDSLIMLSWLDPETVHATKAATSIEGAPAIVGRSDCEVAVIGSGPGGAIAGTIWSEAGAKVAMIEEGSHLPLESCKPFSIAEMVQKYRRSGLTATLGRTKIAYVEAACVGGGSEINSGLYHRTPSDVLNRWAANCQLESASPGDMQPHFEACERDFSVSYLPGPASGASLKLQEGAAALGWKCQEVPRWFRYTKMGRSTANAADAMAGDRQSITRTFIPRFMESRGKLVSDTRVLRIGKKRTRWVLDVRDSSGRVGQISADTVILSAGAIGTPALLQKSSLGKHVGRHLQVHPTIKVVALFDEEVNSAEMGVPVHQVKEFAPRYSFGCSISSKPYLALAMLDHPAHARLVESDWQRMAIYYAMIVPEGHGTVRQVPGFDDPLVTYSLSDGDMRALSEAMRKLCELLFAAGARSLFPSIAGQACLARRDDLGTLPATVPRSRANLMTIHLFSSCPMGENRSVCVADSFGRIHGHDRLLISDASLLPSAPGVNPQGSVMAFARRNAHTLAASSPGIGHQ